MADATVQSFIDDFMTAADAASARAAIGASLGLPSWTYAAGGGTPASGQFTADNADPNGVTTLHFSRDASVALTVFTGILAGSVVVLTNPNGVPAFFFFTSAADDGSGNTDMFVAGGGSAATTFPAGVYQLSIFPRCNVSGLLKGDGGGNISAATAGTDYLTPVGDGSSLTGINVDSVEAASSITPIADGTYNPASLMSGFTFVKGICTGAS